MSKLTTTGTTLTILNSYGPGLEVQYDHTEYPTSWSSIRIIERAVLIGCTHDPLEGERRPKTQVAISLLSDRAKWRWVAPETLLPILRPFSALCTPLPSGEIPAVEVAKLLFEEPDYTFKAALESAEETGAYARVVVTGSWKGSDDTFMLVIYEGWGVDALFVDCDGAEEDSGISTNGVWDKLRAMHFAVNLNPSQFIAK